jgi:hypothetical protein
MKRSNRSNKGRTPNSKRPASSIRIDQPLPEHHLRKLIEKTHAHNAALKVMVYPDPETGEHDITSLGIPDLDASRVSLVKMPSISVTPLQVRGGKGRGKGKGKGKGSGHGNPVNPQVVLAEVQKAFGNVPFVGNTGPIVLGEQNVEFGNASKANYYAAAYTEVVKRHHLLFIEEADFNFLQTVGKANGYGYFCSQQNSRGQAVGFLVHPRLRKIDLQEWHEIERVQGVPDLRSALVLTLEDTVTKFRFTAIVVHLKSMRGGPAVTDPIRYQQCQILAQKLQAAGLTNVVLGGDWNFFVNTGTCAQPLTQIGAKLVYPNDATSTQAMGGRLDAFYTYQLACKLGAYKVRNWWKIKVLGRSFADHGLLSVRTFNLTPCTPGSTDPDCQPGGGADDDKNTEVVTG